MVLIIFVYFSIFCHLKFLDDSLELYQIDQLLLGYYYISFHPVKIKKKIIFIRKFNIFEIFYFVIKFFIKIKIFIKLKIISIKI